MKGKGKETGVEYRSCICPVESWFAFRSQKIFQISFRSHKNLDLIQGKKSERNFAEFLRNSFAGKKC